MFYFRNRQTNTKCDLNIFGVRLRSEWPPISEMMVAKAHEAIAPEMKKVLEYTELLVRFVCATTQTETSTNVHKVKC